LPSVVTVVELPISSITPTKLFSLL
jgi:hypothetical protein